MTAATLFIPGGYEDAHLYMGRLVLLTRERSVQSFRLNEIVALVEQKLPDVAPVATMLFLRNDWLADEMTAAYLRNVRLGAPFYSTLERFPKAFEVDVSTLGSAQDDMGLKDRIILDSLIYARRLYVGTEGGFYHFDIDWDQELLALRSMPVTRLDAGCIFMSAKYGAINASCGRDGLFTAIDDFGWLTHRPMPGLRKTAATSIRTAWSTYDVINYAGNHNPTLLKATHKRLDEEPEPDAVVGRQVLTSVGEEQIDLKYLADDVMKSGGHPHDSVESVFNSNNTFFVHTTDGHLFALGIRKSKGGKPTGQYKETYESMGAKFIGVNPIASGIVAETHDRVLILHSGEWSILLEAEATSVRTFTRSRYYKNIVAITTHTGVFLISVAPSQMLSERAPLTTETEY